MPVPLTTPGGQLDFAGLYFFASMLRCGYLPVGYDAFKQSIYGPAIGPDRIFVDFNNRKRTVMLPLQSGMAIATTGLVATDWPFVALTAQQTVDASGIFAGRVMSPVMQVFAWTLNPIWGMLNALPSTQDMVFAGHSFGGALSVLYAWRAKQLWPSRNIRVVMFGAPMFADVTFRAACPVPVLRIENWGDVVPTLPPTAGYAVGGQGWILHRSGTVHPPYPAVLMPDGQYVSGTAATILERLPKAQRWNTNAYQYGANEPSVLQATQTPPIDPHAIGEYTRLLRRFIGTGSLPTVDSLNNQLNQSVGYSWRVPVPLATPFNPFPPLACPNGVCPPVGC